MKISGSIVRNGNCLRFRDLCISFFCRTKIQDATSIFCRCRCGICQFLIFFGSVCFCICGRRSLCLTVSGYICLIGILGLLLFFVSVYFYNSIFCRFLVICGFLCICIFLYIRGLLCLFGFRFFCTVLSRISD